MRGGKTHIDSDGEKSTHHKNLEHLVFEGREQQGEEWSLCWEILMMVSKSLVSSIQGSGADSYLWVDIKGFQKRLDTFQVILDYLDILHVSSLAVLFNNVDKLLLADFEVGVTGSSR